MSPTHYAGCRAVTQEIALVYSWPQSQKSELWYDMEMSDIFTSHVQIQFQISQMSSVFWDHRKFPQHGLIILVPAMIKQSFMLQNGYIKNKYKNRTNFNGGTAIIV